MFKKIEDHKDFGVKNAQFFVHLKNQTWHVLLGFL